MKTMLRICILLIFVLAFPVTAGAQSSEYRIDVDREFGFGNGADVRGNFAFSLYGDAEPVTSVTYQIDGEAMATVSEAPFRFRFRTGDYPSGWHTFTAVVTTASGEQITTPQVTLNFLSSEQESAAMGKIFGGVLVLILVLTGIGVGSQLLASRGAGANGKRRVYGMYGGAICPRCDRPFPIHFWSINLMAGRLDRCENCGKWSFVRRAAPQMLEAAEIAEQAAARKEESTPIAVVDEQERLRRKLDDSRYTDTSN